MESLETENSRLHLEVTNLKQVLSEMKHQENIQLQNPLADSTTLQSKISNIKNLQEEMRFQQALFKQETETQQQTFNSCAHVLQKRELPPPFLMWRR